MLNRAISSDDAVALVPAVIVANAINLRRLLFRDEAVAASKSTKESKKVQFSWNNNIAAPFPRMGICHRGEEEGCGALNFGGLID